MSGSSRDNSECSSVFHDPIPALAFRTSPQDLQNALKDAEKNSDRSSVSSKATGLGSVKEIEELITNLKKENFNLKLRIYFLEEKLGVNFTLDEDNAIKKNIELNVEIAILQKELQEKHDLLCQAVKAMELEEEEHKKFLEQKEAQLTKYEQQIEDLRSQLTDTNSSQRSEQTSILFSRELLSNSDSFKDLKERCFELEQELAVEKETNASLQLLLAQKEDLKERVETLEKFNEESNQCRIELEEKLKKAAEELQSLTKKASKAEQMADEFKSQVDDLKKKMSSLKSEAEKERKRAERHKTHGEARTADLESDNEKLKQKLHETVQKLEEARADAARQHHLAVPSRKSERRGASPTDRDRVSDTRPESPRRSAQANAQSLPLSPSASNISSPERLDVSQLEQLLLGAGESATVHQILDAVARLKEDYASQRKVIVKLKGEQVKACEIIKNLIEARKKDSEKIATLERYNPKNDKENVDNLKLKTTERKVELRLSASGCNVESSMADSPGEDLADHYKALCDDLETKIDLLKATLEAKDQQLDYLQTELKGARQILVEKDNQLVDLEFKLVSNENGDAIAAKEREIERLETELKKCNCYLQEIVNKELWEKNREIEKMHSKQTGAAEVAKLKKELKEKNAQLKTLTEKIGELELDGVGGGDTRGNGPVSKSDVIMQTEDVVDNQLLTYKQLYQESLEISSALSHRLQELAVFLDSLLKQKSVLGFLGSYKNKRIKELIDNSLELSKSFAMSFMGSPEESLAQLTNITALLNGSAFDDLSINLDDESIISINPGQVTLTYQSHLYKHGASEGQEQVINALREQIANLQCELKLRDNELNKMSVHNSGPQSSDHTDQELEPVKLTKSKQFCDIHSESEDWSEPDMLVSKQRIGLNNTMPNLVFKRGDMSTDDSLNDNVATSRNNRTLSDLYQQNQKLQMKNGELEKSKNAFESVVHQLRQEIDKSEQSRLQYIQKIAELTATLDQVRHTKQQLMESTQKKDKDTLNTINELELEKQSLKKAAATFEAEANVAREELKMAEQKLQRLNEDWDQFKDQLKTEYQKSLDAAHNVVRELELKIQRYDLEYVPKADLERIEGDLNEKLSEIGKLKRLILEYEEKLRGYDEYRKLEQKLKDMEVMYQENYVKKTELEKTKAELENNLSQIETLKTSLCECREKLRETEEMDKDLKQKLNMMHSQCAELEMRNTKLNHQVATLENELLTVEEKEATMQRQFKDIQTEIETLRTNFQQQVASLSAQKSKLEVRNSELEYSNAELHNRLAKVQSRSGYSDRHNFTMPSSFMYASQRHLDEDLAGTRGNMHQQQGNDDVERLEANSSPDLGIESDHGRFSSLEANVPRTVMQTVQITESMNNLLDADNNKIDAALVCANETCVQKLLTLEKDNQELRRKILRMRRTLEETANQLARANQRKKQVEKSICKQIHQTSEVLRKAKANLDSGSESDFLK
ncbi:centrosomin isoform X3 [Aethina tumida]|uniref:centrosomin isoform X3 n=1 Tax=Aethina tumida TaxID=116153 RepID=UPI00096ADD59|nr:centrosomin isoform X3 [Aethina tumida]